MSDIRAGRPDSPAARLARLGVADASRFVAGIAELPWWDDGLLDEVGDAPDPSAVLRTVLQLHERDPQQLPATAADPRAWRRFAQVTGVSQALAEHLVRHPEHLAILAEDAPPPDGEDLRAQLVALGTEHGRAPAGSNAAADALRVANRAALLRIAMADVVDGDPFERTAARLSDLADAVLDGALAAARAQLPADAPQVRLAIIGMGKSGGRELNYISDVDVIFVAEPGPGVDEADALRTASTLASTVMRLCGGHTGEGSIWEVDANLRPEGRAGALVRTLRSHVGYYERWAKTWEFQALLKARAAAGDLALGAAYVDAVLPFVWAAADRDGFVADVQQMRQRVERHVPARDADRQLKLGRGGLRDVEFSVQLLQLVHGRSDVMLRSPNTLTALESLATWGYVGREDAASLAGAYRFLRTLEHRIQLHRLVRSHVVPREDEDLRRLGRAMGFAREPGRELTEAWQRRAHEVRRIHEKLFYRPLLEAVARLDSGQARLTPQAARERLDALGFRDPVGALQHIEALTIGVSRRAAIQRTLLPVMLGWFADAPDPDAGLLGFRRVSDALGATPWFLRLLRDESATAQRLARVLASSRYSSELLLRAPEGVSLLADAAELRPRQSGPLTTEFVATADRYDDAAGAVASVRALRRRELFRISATDILGGLTVDDVGNALTDVADATIAGALAAAVSEVEQARGGMLPTRLLVIGMGRYGGGEIGYGSDADVVFVHDPLPGADDREAAAAATLVVNTLRTLLDAPSTDPPLALDTDLRPEGKQGPLVRTVTSYATYYDRWRSFWEAQALLRADRVAGDPEVWGRVRATIDPIRWPAQGVPTDQLREIRRLKARMENERLPRGADPTLHTKLGRGGLSDVEWVIQLLQLQHAHEVPELRTTRTLAALEAARRIGLLEPTDADVLSEAWRMATRIRNVVMLVRGRPSDLVPTDVHELAAVGRILGYAPGETGALLEDYRRTTRRARGVAERLFYGEV
ncbi:MAG: bifunctional [glutamine synthetase] adenylyltransferase/[glutamine synthetase]-adenylyl-L-tyrosine phosphorylase [Candidatus Nanopelagicales bacterium]|nr:bifunctional [glutamine synthetase] adenylyltransferase/[glutamine synthetase]-adenylyl-L-tyrosine phosphorylase [Candidatus Nanopelagicales bacterium]